MLEDEVAHTAHGDYIGVGACGPAAMGRDLALAVSEAIRPGQVFRGEHRRDICEF